MLLLAVEPLYAWHRGTRVDDYMPLAAVSRSHQDVRTKIGVKRCKHASADLF